VIDLRAMTQLEFDEYRLHALETLTAEFATAHGTESEEARREAELCFEFLIPEGRLPAPDQHPYTILRDEKPVGVVWFGIRRDRPTPEAYVLDLWVEPPWRRTGIATEAMRKVESLVEELGINRVGLNVFEHNTAARDF